MRALSAHDLIQIWEIGQDQHPLDRALTLLSFACPDRSLVDLARLSIGQRDACLLTLRELTFGPQLDSYAECPHCHEPLEFSLNVADIRVMPQPQPAAELTTEATIEATIEALNLRLRLPNSLDLAAVLLEEDGERAEVQLIQRCVVPDSPNQLTIAADEFSPETIAQLRQHLAHADPQAEILLDLTCAACQHQWQVLFDIVEFFWTELCVQAKQLLRQVDVLARAYGWREVDILNMSPIRRQQYLEWM